MKPLLRKIAVQFSVPALYALVLMVASAIDDPSNNLLPPWLDAVLVWVCWMLLNLQWFLQMQEGDDLDDEDVEESR